VAEMAGKTVGDPMLDGTDVGPLASEQQRDDIEKLVIDAVANGPKALCGGAVPDLPGFYCRSRASASSATSRRYGSAVPANLITAVRKRPSPSHHRPGNGTLHAEAATACDPALLIHRRGALP
jgi:Aldehyde dehydrogenase family